MNGAAARVIHSTFVGNQASAGGGLDFTRGTLFLANTLFDGNTGGDCNRALPDALLTDGGGNYVRDGSCGFQAQPSSSVGPLAINGGPSATMALPISSAAYDGGVELVCAATFPDGAGGHDQRGQPRNTCTSGAFEPGAPVVIAHRRVLPLLSRDGLEESSGSLSARIEAVDSLSGLIRINGLDTGPLNIPFTVDWGDGAVSQSFFPFSHLYASTGPSYRVTVTAHYLDGTTTTVAVIVQFPPP
jgi:hypothetical protein